MRERGQIRGSSERQTASRMRGGGGYRRRSSQPRGMSLNSDQYQERESRHRSGSGRGGNRRGQPIVKGRVRGQFGIKHKMWIKRLPARDQEYLNAALSGDIATLRRVIHSDEVDLNVTDGFGHTALINAAWKDRADVVKLLLEKGVSLNCRNQDGQTAMDKAAYWGFTEVLKLLVDAGSKIDIRNNNGETPLHRAAMWGHVDAVKLLLEAKANANFFKNQRRWTPLHFASKHGKSAVVRALLEGKCDPKMKDSNDRTSLELARRSNQQDVVVVLENWLALEAENERINTGPVIASIGEAGGWDAEEPCKSNGLLTFAESVCVHNHIELPKPKRSSNALSSRAYSGQGLSLSLGLGVTAEEIKQDEGTLSVDPQITFTIRPPVLKLTLEPQEGLSVGLGSNSQGTRQVLAFQRLPGQQVSPTKLNTTIPSLGSKGKVEKDSTKCKEKVKKKGFSCSSKNSDL